MNAGNLANHFVHLLHRFAVAEQAFHVHGRQKFLCRDQISSQIRAAAGAIQSKFQGLHVQWLLQEIDCAALKRLQGFSAAIVPAESNHGRRRFPVGYCFE